MKKFIIFLTGFLLFSVAFGTNGLKIKSSNSNNFEQSLDLKKRKLNYDKKEAIIKFIKEYVVKSSSIKFINDIINDKFVPREDDEDIIDFSHIKVIDLNVSNDGLNNGFIYYEQDLIYETIRKDDYEKAAILINKNLDDSFTNPLIRAVNNEDIEAIKFFISLGVNLETPDDFYLKNYDCYYPDKYFDEYKTLFPLGCAAIIGNLDIVKLLIESGANIEGCNNYEDTALLLAASEGHKHIVDWLIKKGANHNALGDGEVNALYFAADNGHIDIVRELLKLKSDINLSHPENWDSPLINAVRGGNFDMSKLLLEYGADLEKKDMQGDTALIIAMKENVNYHNFNIIQLLLAYNAHLEPFMLSLGSDEDEDVLFLLKLIIEFDKLENDSINYVIFHKAIKQLANNSEEFKKLQEQIYKNLNFIAQRWINQGKTKLYGCILNQIENNKVQDLKMFFNQKIVMNLIKNYNDSQTFNGVKIKNLLNISRQYISEDLITIINKSLEKQKSLKNVLDRKFFTDINIVTQ